MKFELEVEREQKNPKIRRVEKMLAQPILKMREESNQLIVNFDPRLVMMLRENERLCKLDIAMPRYVNTFFLKLRYSGQRATVPGEEEGLVPELSRRGRANVEHLHLHHDISCTRPQVLHLHLLSCVLRCATQEAVCPAPQQSESEPGPGNGPD